MISPTNLTPQLRIRGTELYRIIQKSGLAIETYRCCNYGIVVGVYRDVYGFVIRRRYGCDNIGIHGGDLYEGTGS